ncbi:AfsR/SARP family transcriptional regulator [Streptomyces sp. NPDC050535]|uniref:AfsR/SARP family transcriptional regulator n=1 Tax=Streptomyces sp. NPDC050535 TaxID=3365626 RepID=UPI003789AE1E
MRYGILGITQVEDDRGALIAVGGPRVRALLAALAQHPDRTVAPETLIDEVWAAEPPQDAPAALQALVGRLRRAIGKDTVASEAGGYRLRAAKDDVDLFVFERLVREGRSALACDDAVSAATHLRDALALWRGPALADLPDRSAAIRPEALRVEATRTRVEADLRLGRADDVVPELRELTEAHPYDEALHALLIRALRDAGRGADALVAYERTRRGLMDGLGTDPGPELRSLYEELLGGEGGGERDGEGWPSRVGAGSKTQGAAAAQKLTAREPMASAGRGATPGGATVRGAGQNSAVGSDFSRGARNGNIRPRLNSFVGREPEIGAIRSDVQRTRLVTLTGPGGSGKTRLAEEAAAGLPQAWLVALAPLDRPEAVPGAVVSALGLRETVLITNEMAGPQDDPVALLVEYCASRSQLLIFDNCEHVIDAAAELAETLLTHCPGLTILATSREPLGVPGELVRPVEPLPPDPARRLFLERASVVRPDADVALHDSAAVDEICRRLDGLPLAIELAAARLRLLTARQIADRLDDRFRLLTSGSRTVLPRQQTLRAVVDWSWDLLDERERTVLREASVFAGGWDLAAAEAVCTGPAAELVGALVDKSLIVATPYEGCGDESDEGIRAGQAGQAGHAGQVSEVSGESHGRVGVGGGMRYRMLETIHEYATERAAEVPELRAGAERRHRAWVRALVEEAEPRLRSAEQLPWIRRLETELDNIRAATYRAVVLRDEEEAGALVLAMGWFWWLRNFRHEGGEWTGLVLRLCAVTDAGPSTVGEDGWAGASHEPGQGDPLAYLADVDPVAAYLETSASPDDRDERHPLYGMRMRLRMLDLFMKVETDPLAGQEDGPMREYIGRVRSVFEKGGPEAASIPGVIWPLAAYFMGSTEDLRPAMDAAVANCREYGGEWEIGLLLMFRTHMVVDAPGGMQGVDDDLAELRVLSLRVGDRWMRAQVCGAAGEAALARSLFDEAKEEFEESLRLAYEVGAYAEAPFLLARLGEIAYRVGERGRALAALDEASAASDLYGVPDARAFVHLLRAQLALDDGEFAHARELHGQAVVASALGTPPPQFVAALDWVDALITAAESGPEHGLRKLSDALLAAVAGRCADVVLAGLIDGIAGLLSGLGDHRRAARLLAVGTRWRRGHPRPAQELAVAERTEAAAIAALGLVDYESERVTGTDLTRDDALGDMAEALKEHPADA